MNSELKKAHNKAKIKFIGKPDNVFFASILFNLVHEFTEDVPRAAVDGYRLYINPDYYLGLNEEERLGLLMHEVLHVVFNHMGRKNERNHKKWNKACDYAINILIKERGFSLPEGGLLDMQYKGKTAEQIYKLLPDDDNSPCPMEDLILSDGLKSSEETNQHIEKIIAKAAVEAQMSGTDFSNLPNDIAIAINSVLNPEIDWKILLQNYLQDYRKNDYSYRKVNKRYAPDIIIPSAYSEEVGEIAVFIDCSSSVRQHELEKFYAELTYIKETINPSIMHIGCFDTSIKEVFSINHEEDLSRVNLKGRGGTNISPVIEWENTNEPLVTICLTDGYFRKPEIKAKSDFIWLIYDNKNFKSDFGSIIHFNVENL